VRGAYGVVVRSKRGGFTDGPPWCRRWVLPLAAFWPGECDLEVCEALSMLRR